MEEIICSYRGIDDMNILFDLSATQPFTGNDFHGGGEYAKVVFFRLCELLPPEVSLEVFYNPKRNIENNILELCKTKHIAIHYCTNSSEKSALLCERNFDVFYSALPYSYGELTIPAETKFVYTIHGLRALELPPLTDKYKPKYRKEKLERIKHTFLFLFPFFVKSFIKKYAFKRYINKLNALFSLQKNQTIITVSNHSKFAIVYFFPQINISRMKVLYSPLKRYNFDNGKTAETFNSFSVEPGKYILLIGGDRNEKGAYRACRVLYKLIKDTVYGGVFPKDIKILVLGISNYKSYRKLTKNSNRFEFHGYVSTEILEILYKNAFLFMYPTLNEGFGYPPLEAMKYGTICACSANSAITEIYGDSVLYFNPYDDIEMSIRILQSFDEETRKEKHDKIIQRYQFITKKQEQDMDLLVEEILSKGYAYETS